MHPHDTRAGALAGGRIPARLAPISLLLLGAVVWATTYSLYKIATGAGIPFLPFVFWQTLGAGAILLGVSAIRRRLPRLDRAHLRAYAISGILGMSVPGSFYAFVAPKLPAGIVSLTILLEPMLTFALAVLLALEPLRWLRVLGLAFGLAGVLLIVVPETSLPSRDMVGWVLLVLVAPMLFATHNVLIERVWPPGCNALTLCTGGLVIGALFLLPAIALTDSWWFFPSTFGAGEWALLGVTLVVAAGTLLFFEVIRRAGAVFASTGTYLETLAAIGWGILIFGERHSAWVWAAIGLLFVGLYFVNRSGRHRGAS